MPRSVLDLPHFRDEAAAYAKLESIVWPNGPTCPKCGAIGQAGRLRGKSVRPGLWKCYACRKQFRVTVGTVFESSHVPLHMWLQAVYLMVSSKKGVSSHQMSRMLGCTLKTGWFVTMRIREAMRPVDDTPLGGRGAYVEVDDTFIGGKAENRAYGPIPSKQNVMALVQREGRVRSFHVPNVSANTLHPIIGKHLYRDSIYLTDEAPTMTGIGWNFAWAAHVNHSKKEYVRGDGIIHTNTVEGFFSILKRGIYGVYQHVSEAHRKRGKTPGAHMQRSGGATAKRAEIRHCCVNERRNESYLHTVCPGFCPYYGTSASLPV